MPEPRTTTHPQVRELLSPLIFTHSRTVMVSKMQDIDNINTIISVIVNYIRYTF